MKKSYALIFILIHTSSLIAQDYNQSQSEQNYLDAFHERASQQVKNWSIYADDRLVDMADYLKPNENNLSQEVQNTTVENSQAVDSFFLNDKYLDETDKSFVSIRPEARFSSKEDEDFNLKIKAHLALSKSKKRFKLFINDLDPDNANNVATEDNERSAPEIGLNYFAPETYNIQSKYSVGVRGIYPFARARYSSEFNPGDWMIEPIQTFRYSVKDDFKEDTQLYCSTKITDLMLLRFYLARGTQSRIDGMSYDGSMSLYWTPKKNTGFSISQGFNGSTKYQHTEDENAIPIIYEDYNGIYNYSTNITWRENFYRKWLFYEIQPGVNFHKQYDYEANYTFRVLLDIFVGNI